MGLNNPPIAVANQMNGTSLTTVGSLWPGWIIGSLFGAVLFTAVLVPPFASEPVRHGVMMAFSAVCHQLPERSPIVQGVQLAVCHRCIGIYAALAGAPIGFLFLRRWDKTINRSARWLILAAVLVPGTDWLADVLGIWTNTPATRVATGAVFGMTVGYFLCRAFVELVGDKDEPGGSHPALSAPMGPTRRR